MSAASRVENVARKSERSIRMTLSLAFMSPVLAEAAIEGRLPRGFSVKRLTDLRCSGPSNGAPSDCRSRSRRRPRPADRRYCDPLAAYPSSALNLTNTKPWLRPLHLVVRETEFCGWRLAGDFRRRTRENGRNSVRRPRHAALSDRNCEGFCVPGNRVGLPGLHGGGRSRAKPVSADRARLGNREKHTVDGCYCLF